MCVVTHGLCVLGSCAAHEELESPAPAAGLTFLQPVPNCEKRQKKTLSRPNLWICVLLNVALRQNERQK